jgi:cyclic dehypoxanthinyl futalosine synthase
MLQGGLNPALDLGFYEDMLAAVKRRADVCLHSLSPAEVLYLAEKSGLSIVECLRRLRSAGLDSLPGGGAEILVDEVRRRVSPRKITAGGWFAVMEAAQGLGMKTTATMVYGLGETVHQRVEHLLRIRELQDRTGGFTAFIPWSFQPNRTRIPLRAATGVDYLRMVALARLVLDNVPHVQAGWVTEGPDVAQLALSFGADDWGGVLMEERVVRATGVSYAVTKEQVIRLIAETGMTPAQRTTQYEIVREFAGN